MDKVIEILGDIGLQDSIDFDISVLQETFTTENIEDPGVESTVNLTNMDLLDMSLSSNNQSALIGKLNFGNFEIF